MLLNASPTPYDLRFSLFGFPVRVHPIFWIIALMLGGNNKPQTALIWVGAVFVSIIVHELGHAFLQRRFGGRPQIVLYGLGGVASAQGVRDTWWSNILIALAGPAAGFALAGAVYGGVQWLGAPEAPSAQRLVYYLILINIFWGVLNLAPIWPLDGGHVARELLVRFMKPSTGIQVSLVVSMVSAAAIAAYLYAETHSLWNTALFGLLAYQNYQAFDAYRSSRGYR